MMAIGGIALAAAVALVITDIAIAVRSNEGCHGCVPYSVYLPIPLAIGAPLVAVGGTRIIRYQEARQRRVTLAPGRLTLAF